MEVKGTTELTIEIDFDQQQEITETFLMDIFNIPSEQCFIKKGNLMQWWEEGGGSHSWTEEKIVRKATASDKLYFQFKEQLDKLISVRIK